MTTVESGSTSATASSPRTAGPPRAVAPPSRVAVILALLLIAVGVVAMRDAALAAGWLSGQPWIPPALRAVDGLRPGAWTGPAGIVVAVLGAALVVIGIAPRRVTARTIDAATSVYLTDSDVRHLVNTRAADVAGVLRASTSAKRRRVIVRCVVTGGDTDVREHVADEVTRALAPLRTPPRVIVRTRTEKTT